MRSTVLRSLQRSASWVTGRPRGLHAVTVRRRALRRGGPVVDDDADGVGSVAAVEPGDDLLHGFGEPLVEMGGDRAGAGVVGGVADAVEAGQCSDKAGPGDLGKDGPGDVLDFCREVEVLVCSGVFDEEFLGVAVGVEGVGVLLSGRL
ncbi:hypothetical protein ACFWOL_34135 [Streptomyces sp. NPDC058442]|uniref:hypothetical protein n=1 Tax=Streptomyces sp. NPDC058442 TaxID=3346503 RepID=UPI00365DF133